MSESEKERKRERIRRRFIRGPVGRFVAPHSDEEDEVLNLASKYSNEGYHVVIHKRGGFLEVKGEKPRIKGGVVRGGVATDSNEKIHQKIQDVEKDLIEMLSSVEVQLYELSQEMDQIKRKSYKDKFLLQSGADLNGLQQEYPVRVYLGSDKNHSQVEESIAEFVSELESDFIEDYAAEFGSWFKEWIAKTFDRKTNEELKKELIRARKAIEIKTVGLPQSELDKNYSESVAKLLDSIKDQDNAAIQVGALLLVKHKNSNGESQVATKVLNVDQLIALEDNPQWLGEPGSLIEKLKIHHQPDTTNQLTHIK